MFEGYLPLNGTVDAGQNTILEEIYVVAQKREQKLKGVPAAISVTSDSQLTASNAQSISDLAGRIPRYI